MADFPRIELSKIGWDVDPAQEAITVDLTGHIQERIKRMYAIINKAENDRLKKLFEECFEAGLDFGEGSYAPGFEQWWQDLMLRLNEEIHGHPCGDHPAPCNHDPAHPR